MMSALSVINIRLQLLEHHLQIYDWHKASSALNNRTSVLCLRLTPHKKLQLINSCDTRCFGLLAPCKTLPSPGVVRLTDHHVIEARCKL